MSVKITKKLHGKLDQLSHRQRIVVVIIMLIATACLHICLVVRSLTGFSTSIVHIEPFKTTYDDRE